MKNKNMGLLLIDVQNGFNDPYWGQPASEEAKKNISKILNYFRQKNRPVYHAQHLSQNPKSPLKPGQSGVDFMDFAKPILGERVFQKHAHSAFIGTLLEPILRQEKIHTLAIVGITVDHCVSTTARMAANLGFEVIIVADATIAFERVGFDGTRFSAELVHAVTLASLHKEFATILTTNNLIESMLSTT